MDRSRWDHTMIAEGLALLRRALPSTPAGPMTLQAAIAAEHARATSLESTDWRRVVRLYGELLTLVPSPTIAVGRCVALAQLSGPAAGLADLDEVLGLGGLERYPYAFGARAQMLAALGRQDEAADEWTRAAGLARTAAESGYFRGQADIARPVSAGTRDANGLSTPALPGTRGGQGAD
jgi:RNA polymerase sigma-70 factor (ECF subfamily)